MGHIHSVSVVICTRNRAGSLRAGLAELRKMDIAPDVFLEVIVVDNGSTDDSEEVVEDFGRSSPFPVRYVYQRKKGLGYARNAGIEFSVGEIVAFTDDDCFVDPEWLHGIVNEFAADPDLHGIGGRVELYNPRDKPITIMTSRERRVFLHAGQIFSFIHGCNMAFRRAVFRKIGMFDGRFGAGTRIASAEDSDFIYRVHRGGMKLVYCPEVCVYHNHGRRLDAEIDRLLKGYLIGRGAFYCKHVLCRDRDILKITYWEVLAMIKTAGRNLGGGEAGRRATAHLWGLFVGALFFVISMPVGAVPFAAHPRGSR
ncbi:glycosyltransferase family 2 protein [Geobacter sp. SVR]|uniref:glycosyltransferase family 2 protein n=1 Tax=Geobacter sp. SVR TaxID=2495594 RepID=UPI001565436D|nr:glycosyltransferase family A protein [Geobacter sp. SVR]